MKSWLEDPFKSVIAGTALIGVVSLTLAVGIGGVGLLV